MHMPRFEAQQVGDFVADGGNSVKFAPELRPVNRAKVDMSSMASALAEFAAHTVLESSLKDQT